MAMEGNISCSPCKRPLESSSNGNAVGKKTKYRKYPSYTKEQIAEARRWILENYKPTTKDSFVPTEEINKAFNKDHPTANMIKSSGWIRRIIMPLWGKQVYYSKRSVCDKNIRVHGYAGLARKTTEQLAQELKSVLSIPKNDLVFPGWTVEYFEEPPGLHYRKTISNLYLDKQPMRIELNLTYTEDNPATADHQFLNNCKLNASILCRGVVVQGHKTGIWDNNSIPTWERVKNLLTFLDSLPICFGFDLPSECIDEYSLSRRKTFTLYENIKDVLADKGKKRQVSTECELLLIAPACKVCSACTRLKYCKYKKKKRHLKVDEKADKRKNQRYMSRDELKNRIKALNKEVSKLRHQNARMKEKLENDSSSDGGSDDSNDKSDDADDNDETHDSNQSSKDESDVDGDSGSDNDSDDEDRGDCDGSDDDDDNTSDNEDTKAKCRIDRSGDLPVQSTEDYATESLEGITKVVISNLSYIENIFD